MKTFKMKTLVAALAVAGLATACDNNETAQTYQPEQPAVVERSTTAPGTTTPSAYSSDRSAPVTGTSSAAAIDADHQETIAFQGNELTDEAEGKLDNLVSSIDKNKPVAVTIARQEQAPVQSAQPSAGDTTSQNTTTNPASEGVASSTMSPTTSSADSAGAAVAGGSTNPADPTVQGGVSSTGDQTHPQDDHMLSQRADNVREYLESKGVKIVEWNVEGADQQPATAADQAGQAQQDVQQILIVITSDTDAGGISAL